MLPLRIIPHYRLILQYDIRLERYTPYYDFVVKEFVPALQTMGLHMVAVWQTAYGDYPERQVEFVTETLDTIHDVFASEHWQMLEARLQSFTQRYQRKIVLYRNGFQF